MSEKYQKEVSKIFKETPLEKFGDASLTSAEIGSLKKLYKENENTRQKVINTIIESGYPLPENITEEDLAKAGARHACGVTEWLTEDRGEGAKDESYEAYTIKNRFDRFVWKNLSEALREEWRRPIDRESGYVNDKISYPNGIDESKIYGGALPHRILPAQAMKNLELARLGKLNESTLKKWGVDKDDMDLNKFAIKWKELTPVIQNAKTPLELTKSLISKIRG